MIPARPNRRAFMRLAALGALGAAAAACSKKKVVTQSSPAPTTGAPAPTSTERVAAWARVPAAGPPPRSHHSFTANDTGTVAFLFGGKAGSKPLNDLWQLNRETLTWQPVSAQGPAARFGHSAAFVSGHLVIFGGQAEAGKFFNDAWAFDPGGGTWVKLAPAGKAPEARYGASGTLIGTALTISHGFTDAGRFDDTWALASAWTDVSPAAGGARPVKRCLHRAEYVRGLGRMVLYGGQTTGTPFLGDTWLYDPTTQAWTEAKIPGPGARNLYAAGATERLLYLFGGATAQGPANDTLVFDGVAWRAVAPAGAAPPPRSGIEGAIMAGPSMLVFGGTDGKVELNDLWELTLPA